MPSRLVLAVLGVWALAVAGAAHATPFFEIVGGTEETQGTIVGGNIVPAGALGFENRQDDAADVGTRHPLTIFLRDTTAADGTEQTIFVDYVGGDSIFTNEFSAGGGAVQWCIQTSGCRSGFAPLGAGNQNWFGNFAASGSFTAVVGDPIDFTFFAELVGGTPQHTVTNGDSIFEAHMGVFNIENGFDSVAWDRTGMVLGVGLTDGAFSQSDDDHQDLMVRFSVVPEPGSLALVATGLLVLGSLRRRAS